MPIVPMGMILPPRSQVLVNNFPARNPLKYTSNMKEAIEDKLFQTYDLAVILSL